MTSEIPPAQQPKEAYVSMVNSRYGFSSVDLEISDLEISYLNDFIIENPITFHWFCHETQFEKSLVEQLEKIGRNHPRTLEEVRNTIIKISKKILAATNDQFGWFCVKTSLPPDSIKLKRWHIDGPHFITPNIQHKFCITLKGDPTRFYLLDTQKESLRKVIWRTMDDVGFTNDLCEPDRIFSASNQEGIFFIMANPLKGALHAEPQVLEPRLFISIVPASEEKLTEIKKRIQRYSPPSEQEIFLTF